MRNTPIVHRAPNVTDPNKPGKKKKGMESWLAPIGRRRNAKVGDGRNQFAADFHVIRLHYTYVIQYAPPLSAPFASTN